MCIDVKHLLTLQLLLQLYRQAVSHLEGATTKRKYYKDACEKSSKQMHALFTEDDIYSPPPPPNSSHQPNSLEVCVHYSFDFAHLPSNPLRPGAIYFLTPCKCGLFGVTCESIPRQVNFLIDEADDMGKGANSICSMLHYFFSHHGLGEQTVHLNADNCIGQNKNNIVIQVHLMTCMKK